MLINGPNQWLHKLGMYNWATIS